MSGRSVAVTAGGSRVIGPDAKPKNVTELASGGWLVEVCLISEREGDLRFFAVGLQSVSEAEEAILRFPGLLREDKRSARRRLAEQEITFLGLREGGVRPYIRKT